MNFTKDTIEFGEDSLQNVSQIIQLNLIFLRLSPERRRQTLELMKTLQAGYAALAISQAVRGKILEIPDIDDESAEDVRKIIP
jgi:hypothetical protein